MLELCESEMDYLKTLSVVEPENAISVSVDNININEPKESQEKKDCEILNLYTSMAIDMKDPSTVSHIRLDTIHIQGLNEMSTKDVYSIFYPMKPMTLEWINDSSCNAVWSDKNSAAKALLKFSHPEEVKTDTKKLFNNIFEGKEDNQIIVVEEEEDDDVDEEDTEDGELPDKKNFWRVANQQNEKKLKFRFATWDDKKIRGAEKYSQYYKKYGNPNFGGLKGLISGSRKRKLRQGFPVEPLDLDYFADDPEEQVSLEDKRPYLSQKATVQEDRKEAYRKPPKMMMYADEEERKSHKLKASRILSRLGSVTVNVSLGADRGKSDQDELENSSPQEFGSKSVWDRLQVEVTNTEFSSQSDKKRSYKTGDHDHQRDLRKKLQIIRNSKRKDHSSPMLLPEPQQT